MSTRTGESPRRRMVRTAAVSMRERGVEATSFSHVLVDARAARGSLYHYFPGGKAQLIAEATDYAGDFVAAQFSDAFDHHPPGDAVMRFAAIYLELLRESDFGAGCPVLVAGLEGERNPPVRDAAGKAFARWEHIIARALQRRGVPPPRALSLATLMVSALEGAVALSRARRSTVPVESTAAELRDLLETIAS